MPINFIVVYKGNCDMSELNKLNSLAKYKSIFGDAQATIQSIQKFINSNNKVQKNYIEGEEEPAASINRILNSTVCEDTSNEIQKIIKNL